MELPGMKLLTLLYYLFRRNQHRRPMPGSAQCRTQSEKPWRTPQRPCGFRAFFFLHPLLSTILDYRLKSTINRVTKIACLLLCLFTLNVVLKVTLHGTIRFLAHFWETVIATRHYSIGATLFRTVAALLQHCNAVLRWESSLQIVSSNITFNLSSFCGVKYKLKLPSPPPS